ncbi:MAG: hydratase [Bradyrhizobium sp.]|nr:MAG: hydratase [Bradyrhizobium sp.]
MISAPGAFLRLEIGLLETTLRKDVIVACIQFEPIVGSVAANREAMERQIRAAQAGGASIVVLPELADSGYVFEDENELAAQASPVPGGATSTLLCNLSRELNIVVVSGLAERDGDAFFNTAIVCGPDGFVGKYRKLHLWNEEKRYFRSGDLGLPVFDTPLGRIGVAICYDGWFPETFRQLTLNGALLVCVPTNWVPMPGGDLQPEPMANVLHKAAAHSNGVYIACADRIGTERGQSFLGRSVILGPTGWPVAGPASADRAEIIFAKLELGAVAAGRRLSVFNDLISDRRSDVYG